MKLMSETGRYMLAFQEQLVSEYGYAPIEPNLFLGDVRQKYKDTLPGWCKLDGDPSSLLYTLDGTLICWGYNRVVLGDLGAYIEISPEQICEDVLRCKPGQEYRYKDPRYARNVKYLWLTAKDRSDCKIYLQKKRVSYADYVPGMYYISPYELDVTK